MKTRTRRSAPSSKAKIIAVEESNQTSVPKLETSDENPPFLAILPKPSHPASRVITIPTCERVGFSKATRYYVDPGKGFYEFTKIPGSIDKTRSWLLAPGTVGGESYSQSQLSEIDSTQKDGYLLSDSTLLLATPIDPLFIILGIDGAVYPAKDAQGRSTYSTMDNHIWELKQRAPHLRAVFDEHPDCAMQKKLESRLRSISDQDPNGCDGIEYCISLTRLARELLKIAKRMVAVGLPKSLEVRFVRPALEVPEQILKREDSLVSLASEQEGEQQIDQPGQDDDARQPTEEVVHLLRIRVALQFLLTKYIRVDLSKELQAHFKNPQAAEIDFGPLDDRLDQIAKLKEQAQALRSISDNISRKRGAAEDEESMERFEAKKRKKEEEEAKKKNMSQGVKKLLKADTSGMKKLSSFFTKPPAKKS